MNDDVEIQDNVEGSHVDTHGEDTDTPSYGVLSNPFFRDVEDNGSSDSSFNTPIEDKQEKVTATDIDTLESDESNYEPYPSFLPEDLVPEDTYESQDKELEWYKQSYDKLVDHYQSEEFGKEILKYYEKAIIEKEGEVEKIIAIKQALDGNPEEAFRLYFGKQLASYGHPSYIPEDTGQNMVDKELVQLYGKNYTQKYDPEEANIEGTLSNAMLRTQQQVLDRIEAHNREIDEQIATAKKPVELTEEELQVHIQKDYETYFKPNGVTKEEFDNFVEDSRTWQPTLADLYFAFPPNKEEVLRAEYERGLADGKKGVVNNIKRATQKVPVYDNGADTKNGSSDHGFDRFNPYSSIYNINRRS